jgi:hypothetical protein
VARFQGHLRHHLAKFIRLVTRAAQNRRHRLVRQKIVERCPGAEAFGAPKFIAAGESRSVKFDIGFGTILDHLTPPPGRIGEIRPNLPWTETEQVGLDPKPAAGFAAAEIVSRLETLASRVFLEPTCAGHEPRTMRLFSRPRRPLSESPSCHDSTLACSVASITELFRLESVGPSHKAVGTAIRQGDIHLSDLSKKSTSSENGVDIKIYEEISQS